jgi:hypothetical protein
MRAFFDWFFNTAAGHWVLNDMTYAQFFAICFVIGLTILSLGKIALKIFRMVNWGFIGRELKGSPRIGKLLLWD